MLNTLHPGKVQETTRATRVEAFSGRDNRKYMTPLRTKQVVDWVVDDSIEAAIETAKIELDDVLSVASANLLPNPGASGKIYIVGKLAFYWNGTGYDQISVENSDRVPEGTTNLYFTNSRAKSALAENLLVIETQINGKAETLHNHAISEVTGLFSELDGKQPAGSYAPAIGIEPTAISGTAVVDADPRLTDARPPTAHKSSHAANGTDALTPADIGAATAAQGAKADTSLQQGAYISAASLEVGSIAAGQTADLYVGLDGKVGIGTETPTEKLTVSGHIDILGGQVKNLGTPVDDTDAATKGFVDTAVAGLQPAGSYATADHTHTAADIGAVPNIDSPTNPVARAAVELRTEEGYDQVALKYAVENDSWQVHDPDNFRQALGAALADHHHLDPHDIRVDAVYAYGSAWHAAGDDEGINGLYLRDGSDDGKGVYRNANGYVIFWSENFWRLGDSSRSFSYFATDEDRPFPWGDAGNPLPTWELGDFAWPPFTPLEIKIPPTIISATLGQLNFQQAQHSVSTRVAKTGNASADQLVLGSDTRLTNARTPTAHTHSASDIRTTVVRAQIPQGDLLFYFDSSASPYNDRPIYRTPSGYTLWFNSTNETWNISENLLFFEEENILLTSDEDNRQHPWEAAWTHDITLATLADYTQEAFKTWASKNDLLNLKNRFASLAPASIGAATAAQGAKADGAETLLNNLRDPSKELADWTVQRAYALWDDSYESRTLQFSGYDENASVFIREDYIAPFRTRLNLATTIDVSEVNAKIDNEIHWRGVAISQLQTQVDGLIPQAPTTGTYTLRSVDGVVSWVEPDYKATYEEAISATSNDRWMTPLLVSQLINLRDDVLDFSLKSQFPATGEKGRIYMAGSIAYLWTGDTYEKISRDSVFNSASQPTDPQDGDRWIDSTTFIAYEYFGGNWIQTAV